MSLRGKIAERSGAILTKQSVQAKRSRGIQEFRRLYFEE
jgi:hypothetical protein